MQGDMQMHSNVCADDTTEGKTAIILHQRGGPEALDGSKLPAGETKTFALADLKTSARLDLALIQVTKHVFINDLLAHLGVDLALRCLRSEPCLHTKEYANREVISPLLYVASVLAGKHLTFVSCKQPELLSAY